MLCTLSVNGAGLHVYSLIHFLHPLNLFTIHAGAWAYPIILLTTPRTETKETDDYITDVITYRKLKLPHVTRADVFGRSRVREGVCVCVCLASVCFVLSISNLKHATYGHCAASMQAVDGSLGFSVTLEFNKSAPCKRQAS